jgi:hypothetical protein
MGANGGKEGKEEAARMAIETKRGELEYPDGIEEVRGSNPLGSTKQDAGFSPRG